MENNINFFLYNVKYYLKIFYDFMDFNTSLFEEKVAQFNSDELAKIWNDKVLPIRNELLSKLQTQASLNVQQNNKMVNPNMRIH